MKNNINEAREYLNKANALDSENFLLSVTRIILANQSSPEMAMKQFNLVFPDVAPEINRIIGYAILSGDTGDRVLH
ncbi:MAG TPA: hypothetical protein DDY37_04890 [Legionella sp.]|nr:hypothetical protein [Legionella sp.]